MKRTFAIRSRVARPASLGANLLKSLGHTAVLWAVFLFAIPSCIDFAEERLHLTWSRFDPGAWGAIATAVFWTAALVGFWSGYVLVTHGDGTPMPLACTRRLVITGPYRFLRNPMSAMAILQGISVGVYLGSVLVISYALAGAVAWHSVLRPWEERDLLERFGNRFDKYRRAVRCWIPRLTPFDPPSC